MNRLIVILLVLLYAFSSAISQATVSATYTAGDIPTSYPIYDATCTGPVTTLTVTLPGCIPNFRFMQHFYK